MNKLPNEILDLIVQNVNNVEDFLTLTEINPLFYNICKRYYIDRKLDYYHKKYNTWYGMINNKFRDYLAKKGQLELIKYLLEKKEKKITYDMGFWAAIRGHFELIKYLIEKEGYFTADTMHITYKRGHTKIAHYIYENAVPEGDENEKWDFERDYAFKNKNIYFFKEIRKVFKQQNKKK